MAMATCRETAEQVLESPTEMTRKFPLTTRPTVSVGYRCSCEDIAKQGMYVYIYLQNVLTPITTSCDHSLTEKRSPLASLATQTRCQSPAPSHLPRPSPQCGSVAEGGVDVT